MVQEHTGIVSIFLDGKCSAQESQGAVPQQQLQSTDFKEGYGNA